MDATPQGINRRLTFDVTDSLRARFTARILRQDPATCWPWLGAIRNGYGAIKHNGRVLSAHVVAWVLANGDIPPEAIICHTCDDRICCNPAHLYAGSPASNVRDSYARRAITRPHGQEKPNAKLTDDLVTLVLSLRRCLGWSGVRIAGELDLNRSTVNNVIGRAAWSHVPIPTSEAAANIIHEWKRERT
jgi:hypothetical protein